jgi:hypothetical protein
LLPFLVLLFVPIGGLLVTALLIAATTRRAAWIVKGVVALALAAALVEGLACAGVVHSVHAAYSVAVKDARFQERLR